jgi:hypothetical protein
MFGSADKSMVYTRQHRLVGADCMLQENSWCYLPLAAHTSISCTYFYILLLWQQNVELSIQDGGLNKGQKFAHHHIPIQIPSVDVSCFLLDISAIC